MLTRGFIDRGIGKPGQSNSHNGIKLNDQANLAARVVQSEVQIGKSRHKAKIADKAVVEAFPTTFLGLMIEEPQKIQGKGALSDIFFEALTANGKLEKLIGFLSPDQKLIQKFDNITNHDERAALVCAITALCVARKKYCAVGGGDNGWIILPPKKFIRGQYLRVLKLNLNNCNYHELSGGEKAHQLLQEGDD
jgi:hypothetical protein